MRSMNPTDQRRRVRRIGLTTLLALLWILIWRAPTRGAPPTALETPASSGVAEASSGATEASFGRVTSSPIVADAINRITPSSLYRTVGDLSGAWPISIDGRTVTLTTRYSRADPMIGAAETYARQRFLSAGLDASCQPFPLGSTERCNIVAEQRGVLEPERIVVLGAHLDSTSTDSDAELIAPGADDNASGVAAVLAAAELLSDYDLPFTLHYVLFTGEEQGLYGSTTYAQAMAAADEEIIAVLNLDMIGHNSNEQPVPVMQLHIRSGDAGDVDRAIAQVFTQIIAVYDLPLVPEVVASGILASDHASFWREGYPAVLAIEDFADFNPHYHSRKDQLERLSPAYLGAFARAAVGTAAHLAGVVDFIHTPTLAIPGQPVSFAAVSNLPASAPVSYAWDLGGEAPVYGSTVTHTFPLNRTTQPITLTVIHPAGELSVSHMLRYRFTEIRLPLLLREMR